LQNSCEGALIVGKVCFYGTSPNRCSDASMLNVGIFILEVSTENGD
jgi:hypothetical protein